MELTESEIGRTGRILHLKSEIRNLKLDRNSLGAPVQFKISDFGFEMQDSSNSSNFRPFCNLFTLIKARTVPCFRRCFRSGCRTSTPPRARDWRSASIPE